MKKRITYIIILLLTISLIFVSYKYYQSINSNIEIKYQNELLSELYKLSKEDERIIEIIDHHEEYPNTLLYMLSRDLDMLDFVIDFPKNKNQVFSDDVGDINLDTVPLFLQWDKRWGYGQYGSNNLAINGCGPTSLAMVLVYLTKDKTITPYKVAKMAEEKGYYVNNGGTTWDLMHYGSKNYGVTSKEIPLSKDVIYNALNNHHPIICNVTKGDFTTSGHYIVLSGIENNLIKVNDPNSIKRSNELWDYDRLKGQIKNLWEFYIVE